MKPKTALEIKKMISIDTWLQSSRAAIAVKAYLARLRFPSDKAWTLHRMTGLTPDEFTKIFVDNADACINAPSYDQLVGHGYSFQ